MRATSIVLPFQEEHLLHPLVPGIDIRSDYVAKYGTPSAVAPNIFFRYYYVNSSTGEKSGVMLAETTWTAAAAGGGD